MNRLLLIGAMTLAVAGCTLLPGRTDNPYEQPPFYAKYLDGSSPLDVRIQQTLDGLQANPQAASLHNELGALLVQKGFPKDAEREFERAIDSDRKFYPAWYNLGLARAAAGEETSARTAFRRTVRLKPGHPAALFQLGLIEEKAGNTTRAIDYYAKALKHNPKMLDVRVNPGVVNSRLIHRALIKLYPRRHAEQSMRFQPAPPGYVDRVIEAPSPQPKPEEIITPAPPPTDPAVQPTPPPPGAASASRAVSDVRRPSRPADVDAPPPPPVQPLDLVPNASAAASLVH